MSVRDGGENVRDRQQIAEGSEGRSPFTSRATRKALEALKVSGEALTLTTDLQSENYDPGVAGWKLGRDAGDLEANDAIIRGALEAAGGIVEIDDGGIDIEEGATVASEINWEDGSGTPTARLRKLSSGGLEVNADGGVTLGGGPWGAGFHDVFTAGRLQVGSHSSLSGLIWDGMTIPEPAGVQASRSVAQNVPNATVEVVYLNSRDWQYGALAEADRGPGYLEIGPGLWQISAYARMAGSGIATRFQVQIRVNGSIIARQEFRVENGTKLMTVAATHVNTSGTDEISVAMYHNDGSTGDCQGTTLSAVRMPAPIP